MSVAMCFNSSATGAFNRTVASADDGNPTDSGNSAYLELVGNPATPYMRARVTLPGGIDMLNASTSNWFDGRTHMAVATVSLSGGLVHLLLYVDGVAQAAETSAATGLTEFPLLTRFNAGCSPADTLTNIFTGTLSHAAGWNVALTQAQVTDLWTAAQNGFAGDLPGARTARIAAWKGLTATAFESGVEALGSHPAAETALLDAFRLVARSEGGLWFLSRDGYATLHARSHRTNAASVFTLGAHQLDRDLGWTEDPQLIANDVAVKYGAGSDNQVRAIDQASQDDYGVQTAELDTILATDTQALDRADAYLTRYREPVSRPDSLSLEALAAPDKFTSLLATEYGQKFTITGLPTGAPAASVDLFIEGIGEDISDVSWKFTFDASPAGFDFGLLLDDPVRGLLGSNYVGF
jgi:hypothetical protein